MQRSAIIIGVALLCGCASTPDKKKSVDEAPCSASRLVAAKVQRSVDKARNVTVLRVGGTKSGPCGPPTQLVVAASFEGKQAGVAPSELTFGLLSRHRSFRLQNCTAVVITADGQDTRLLAERVAEIGRGGMLHEYVLGPVPLQVVLRLIEAQTLRISACGVVHQARPDEQRALLELLKQLGAR